MLIYGGAKIIPRPPKKKLAIFCASIPNYLPLTISFNTGGQRLNKIPYQGSKIIHRWAIPNKCESYTDVVPYSNEIYTHTSIIDHVKSQQHCTYHYAIHHYLSILYCNKDGKL